MNKLVKQIGRGDLTLIDFNDVTASLTAPSNPSEGAMWFNKNDNQLYVFENNKWTLSTKGMEFGGRNLLFNTAFSNEMEHWTQPNSTATILTDTKFGKVAKIVMTSTTQGGLLQPRTNAEGVIENGNEYTTSVWLKADSPIKIDVGIDDGGTSSSTSFNVSTNWERFTFTRLVSQSNCVFRIYTTSGVSFYVAQPMVERGNVASDWTPAPEDADAVFEDIMETLGNMANDNLLNYAERKIVKDKLTEVTGIVTADATTSIPTTSVLDAGKKGDFYSVRQSALNAGLLTTDAVYIDVATKYNTLRTYLSTLSPRPWDLSVANKDRTVPVVKATFSANWLNYFTSVNNLAIATAEKLKKNVDDIVVGGANFARNGNFGIMLNDSGWKDSYIGGVKEIVDISTEKPPFQYALHILNTVNGNGGIATPVLWEGATAEGLVDKEVTVSFWLKFQNIVQGAVSYNLGRFAEFVIEGTTSTGAKVYTYPRATSINTVGDTHISGTDMVWKKYTITHKLTLPSTAIKLSKVSLFHGLSSCRGEFWTTGLQIELGNKATDWKYSDEDMNQRVTNAEFKVSDSQIISTVTSSQPWSLETAKIKNSTDVIADMMSDLKITPIEKSSLKTLWDEIQAKYAQILALANTPSIAVSPSVLTTAYTALNTTAPRIQTDILANMSTTYTLTAATRDAFKAQVNTFYVEAEKLNKAISDKINQVANEAKAGLDDMLSDLKITPLEKSELLRNWQKIQAQYVELNAQAVSLGVSSTIRSAYTAAYNALNTTSPRIQTDILANMTTTYALTTATRDTFKTQLNTYFTQAEKISRANTDSIQTFASRVDQKADGITTTVTGINNRLGTAESKIDQTANNITLKVWTDDISKAVDDLEIGGRNLLVGSQAIGLISNNNATYPIEDEVYESHRRVRRRFNTTSTDPRLSTYTQAFYPSITGRTYTDSIEVKPAVDMMLSLGGTTANELCKAGVWTRLTSTAIHTSADTTRRYFSISGTGFTETNNPWVEYRNLKAEEGNKATDWTPAPEDIEGKVSGIESRLSTAEIAVKADSIISKVTQSTAWTSQTSDIGKVQTNLDNLEVGGRNLALDTNSENWLAWGASALTFSEGLKTKAIKATRTGASAIGMQQSIFNRKIKLDFESEYTLTFKLRGTVGLRMNYVFLMNTDTGNQNVSNSTTITSETKYQTFTEKFKKNTASEFSYVMISTTDGANGTWFEVAEVKLEKGNKATDWTPAPEDVSSDINTAENNAKFDAGWVKGYDVSGSIQKNLLHPDDTPLNDAYTYEFQGRTTGTGTESTAITIFRSKGDGNGWDMETVYEMGTGSNHPRFILDTGGKPTVLTSHASTYVVEVHAKRVRGRETLSGTLNKRLSSAEIAIKPNAIVSTVKESTEWTEQSLAIGKAQATADNIKVGAKNIVLNSNFSTGDLSKWTNNGAVTYALVDGKKTAKLGTGTGIYQIPTIEADFYTFSFLAKAPDSTTSARVGFLNAGEGASKYFNLTTSWQRYTFTTTISISANQVFHVYSSGKTYNITDIKVEKGNIATDWTPAIEDIDELIAKAQGDANKANTAILDMSSDGKISPVEKVQLKKEWAVIVAEKVSLDGTADTFGITTQKVNLNTAYNSLNSALVSVFANMATTTTVNAASFRGLFDDFYDKKAILQRKVSESARGLAMSSLGQGQITVNPIFAQWTSTYPDGFSLWSSGTGFSKETSISKNGGYGARFSVTSSATQIGMTIGTSATITSQKEPDFVMVEVDYMLVSGSIGGAGILLDWGGLSNNRQTISFLTENPSPTLNKWYTVRKLVPKPTGTTGTFSNMIGFVMANYSSGLGTTSVKNIIFDRFALREPTEEELKAYNSAIMIADMSSDSKITPVEKVQLKKEWAAITSERLSIDGMAGTFGITTERTNMTNSYNALQSTLTSIFSNMATTSTVTATTFRATFDDYYDKKAILQRKVSETARGLANSAQTDANTANTAIGDIMSDLKITPVEKSTLKVTWDEIQAKNTNLVALAGSLGVSTASYTPTFTALNTTAPRIQTDILASMSTTYNLTTATRDNFKAQMNNYFVQAEALSKAISDKINGNAGNAQSGVNDLISDLKITPLEKSELQRTWEIIKAQYAQLNLQASELGVLSTLRTEYTNAYNALNSSTPRIQTDILASMTTTYSLTTTTRDNFKTQMTAYQVKAQEISKAITDKLDVNTKTVQTNVNILSASVGNLVNNPSVTGTVTGWSSATLATQSFQGEDVKVIQNVSSGNGTIYSDYFDVDPSKAYEVSVWFKKSQPTPASSNTYIGTNQIDASGGTIPITYVSNSDGSTSDSTNFYFFYRGGTANFAEWEKITGYILPSGFDTANAKGISNALSHAMMKPTTKKMRIRMLNYNNTTTSVGTMWMANPKVVEVPTELISRVSSAQSKITQLASDITFKVSSTDYNGNTIASMINQTATTIKLKAENIELNGITTVANQLNIGSTFADNTYKSLKFRGDHGLAYIDSPHSDAVGMFGFAYAYVMGASSTSIGNDGGDDIRNASDLTRVDARSLLEMRTDINTLKMDNVNKNLKLNGYVIGFGENPILWDGGVYLQETQTITPSKKLSECPNGWILLWSRYVNGASANSDWNTTIIPKNYTAMAGSSGMWCPLVAANVSATTPPMAYKYIYPNDTRIIGHARNNTGTESGQVLRYVLAF